MQAFKRTAYSITRFGSNVLAAAPHIATKTTPTNSCKVADLATWQQQHAVSCTAAAFQANYHQVTAITMLLVFFCTSASLVRLVFSGCGRS